MAVPTGNIAHDINCCEDSLHFAEPCPGDCSNDKTSAPVLSVVERLIESYIDGVVVEVSCDLIGIPCARTSFDVNCPVKVKGPSGLFLAWPRLNNVDAKSRSSGNLTCAIVSFDPTSAKPLREDATEQMNERAI
jgi:hypothetical protein